MGSQIAYIAASILLPPFCFILLGGAGVVLWKRRPRLGRALAGAALALLWIVSTAAFNLPFLDRLGWPQPADLGAARSVRAIVVLGGGISPDALEYGGADTINSRTLERVRYAAWLHRQTGLPILAAGGTGRGAGAAEADLMKAVLEKELGTPVRWTETRSHNTLENARESAAILRAAGISRAYLVTSSMHMRRSLQAFAGTGIDVLPAPTGILTREALDWRDFLPSALAFGTSAAVFRELLGRAWYALRQAVD